jgi:hypothetical protein
MGLDRTVMSQCCVMHTLSESDTCFPPVSESDTGGEACEEASADCHGGPQSCSDIIRPRLGVSDIRWAHCNRY